MSNQKTIRVLIADDDYMVGKSTGAILEKMRYNVVGQALNGREAVEMTQSLHPDVVLMDIKMPLMDGIEATRRIYGTCPTPVVALTAYVTPEVIEQAIAAGIGAYLTKPVNVQDMERAIAVAIARFDDMVELSRLNTELKAEIAERERAEEEIRQRALEQETLREAALALTTALDRNEVIERILAQLQQVVPYDSASIQLLQEDMLVLIGGRGFPNLQELLGTSFPAGGDNPNREVMRTLSPSILEDAPILYEAFTQEPFAAMGIRSWLGVPLMIGDRPMGMITLDKREPGFYTQEHARLAEAFAAQAAVAIENARLFEETEQRAAELEVLRRTSLRLTSSLDLTAVLDSIAENALSLVGATNCHLYLYDEASETFTFGAALWQNGRREAAVKMPRRDGLTALVAHEGHPLVINDASRHYLYTSPKAQKWGLQAIASFPLRRAGRVVGVFSIVFLTPHTFSREELRVLGLLADQAAVAIENARLFEEEKRRNTQLALINDVGEKAISILDSNRLMQEVSRSIQESFDYYNVALLLLDEERREVVLRAIAGGFEHVTPGDYRQPIDEGIVGFVARTGSPWLANDTSKDPYYVKGFSEEILTESELCIPIKLGDEMIGVLDVQSVSLNTFDQADVVVMEAVADRVAIGIQNARLFEEMAGLYDVGLAVTSALELDKALKVIYEQVNHLMSLDTFYIALYDEARGELHFEIFVEEGEWLPKFTQKLDDGGLTAWIVQTRKPIFVADIEEERENLPVTPSQKGKPGTRSWMGFPLIARGKVVGVISAQSFRPQAFTEGNKRILSAFANQAAIAIENARLFEEIEERRVYLEGVLGAVPDAIVTLDAYHQIAEWNTGAEKLFGYSREEAIGQNIDYLVTRPDVFEEAIRFTQTVTDGGEVPPTETVRYRKDDSPVDVIVAGSPILVGGEVIGAVIAYTDITTRKQMEETLRALALIDDLTNLYNRRGFVTLGRQQLKAANRTKRRMVLLFADFDGLKQINDAFGHPEGDRALIEVANVFRETFRESDIIARIGGDEFVVLAIETDGTPAEILATRFQEGLRVRNARKGRRYKLSLSVGLARYDPEYPCSIDELLAQADRAMYDEKRGDTPG